MSQQVHTLREAWLEAAVKYLEPIFSKAGYAIPPVRVSCGRKIRALVELHNLL